MSIFVLFTFFIIFAYKNNHPFKERGNLWFLRGSISAEPYYRQLLCRYLARNINRILSLEKKSKIMQLFSNELKITLIED